MKVTRLKKSNKRINFFINHFGFHLPIQVLLDGTFCFAAFKVNIINKAIKRKFPHKACFSHCRTNL